jgi:hypothetical protein
MVLSWICQWWRLGVPSGVRLADVGVGRLPLLRRLQKPKGLICTYQSFMILAAKLLE